MNDKAVNIYDWERILAGQAPPVFYLEIVIRATIIYIVLMTSMRLIGPRMSSRVSRLELATMVALASAIGVPMLDPAAGMLPVLIIAIPVVMISRFIAKKSYDSERFERIVHGKAELLVNDGMLDIAGMRATLTTRERLWAHLRSEGIVHLGSIKRVYLEQNGQFTIVKNSQIQPGLCILPSWDGNFIKARVRNTDIQICHHCGAAQNSREVKCQRCGHEEWTAAVLEK